MIVYSFIRSDLPIQHQLVQIAHSAYEAGGSYNRTEKPPRLIVLDIKDSLGLEKAQKLLEENDINYHNFFEPDNDFGYTSITTEPLTFDKKTLFSEFSLWHPERSL